MPTCRRIVAASGTKRPPRFRQIPQPEQCQSRRPGVKQLRRPRLERRLRLPQLCVGL